MIEHLTLQNIQNMMDINVDLLQWYINFLIKNSLRLHGHKPRATGNKSASGGGIKNENISNKELAEELEKIIIKNLNKESKFIFYKKYLGCWSC